MCGATEESANLVKNTGWSLCGYLYCEEMTGRELLEQDELCKWQSQCTNLDTTQIKRLKCCNAVAEDQGMDGELCISEHDDISLSAGDKLCNDICDDWNCGDESDCNGFFYGKSCKSKSGNKVVSYHAPYEICNDIKDCVSIHEFGLDEKGCNPTGRPKNSICVSAELLIMKNIRRVVPIFNFTRCSSIKVSKSGNTGARLGIYNGVERAKKFGMPYCHDYLDQTNCSDVNKVGVSCHIEGYGFSTISKTMVCGPFRRGFCDNGMDLACVDADRNCTVHKHQFCDEIKDCTSGADENDPDCLYLTKQKCSRYFYTGRELSIPVSWLGDGLRDCTNGIDENWQIVCGQSFTTRRFEVSEVCHDVFICRYGAKKFIRLTELCNGIDKCGNENLICQVGQSLSSVSTAVSTVGNTKTLIYCHKGLEDVINKHRSLCVSQEFNPFKESIYGVQSRISVKYPIEKIDCRFVFGEAYVLLSCMGRCVNSSCPLKRPIEFNDCPAQYRKRVLTVVNKYRLTFVTRRANEYHNDYFMCSNGLCTDYDKVCNMWDDCGDASDEVNCTNTFHCKDRNGNIPLSKKCDNKPDCGDMSDECNLDCSKMIINHPFLKGAAWLIGLMAMVSNAFILIENGKSIPQCKSADSLTNKLLINLIGLGDFMMGLYLLMIAAADTIFFGEEYCGKQYQWLTSWHCSCLGVISTLGSLLSLFSLTILSFTRALKIKRGTLSQDEDISGSKKLTVVCFVSLIVVFAAAIAAVTLLPMFEDYFLNGLVYENTIKIFPGTIIGKRKHLEVIQSYYGRSKDKTLRWRLMEGLVRSMFSKEYGNLDGKIARVDFYGNDGVCLFKFFVTKDDPQWIFTMVILAITIVCFTIVAAAYIFINISTYRSSKSLTREAGPTAKAVNKRNRKLQRKVATIILTDFLCWVPFVLICMLHFFEAMDASSQYGLFSIIILPINSVINPFLYSETMSDLSGKVWLVFPKLSGFFTALSKADDDNSQNVDQTKSEHREEIKLKRIRGKIDE